MPQVNCGRAGSARRREIVKGDKQVVPLNERID